MRNAVAAAALCGPLATLRTRASTRRIQVSTAALTRAFTRPRPPALVGIRVTGLIAGALACGVRLRRMSPRIRAASTARHMLRLLPASAVLARAVQAAAHVRRARAMRPRARHAAHAAHVRRMHRRARAAPRVVAPRANRVAARAARLNRHTLRTATTRSQVALAATAAALSRPRTTPRSTALNTAHNTHRRAPATRLSLRRERP